MQRWIGAWPYAVAAVALAVLAVVVVRPRLPASAPRAVSTIPLGQAATDEPEVPLASLIGGTCAVPGEVLHELDGRDGLTGGERAGSAAAAAITYSVTQIEASFDDLIAESHAVVVPTTAEDPAAWIACGEIGGYVDDDGLPVGLRAPNGGLAGIAILWNDDDSVEVEIYLEENAGRTSSATPDP